MLIPHLKSRSNSNVDQPLFILVSIFVWCRIISMRDAGDEQYADLLDG